ncbi:hypothetical protein BB8028_0003g06680 [Beauveria bassiana]|uniref:Uncharacterized protein n=1 Tax=Beauveria bassiana TaxID=176275 RepID=A0A2S7Y7M1_BEABA|nr:hypothetical protein BB8028_0003g06680 [Beauveria bassiana]
MCWTRWKTPARFPDCTGKDQKNCIPFDPAYDHIQWCPTANARGHACDPPIQTSQASSTKRGRNCPAHRH